MRLEYKDVDGVIPLLKKAQKADDSSMTFDEDKVRDVLNQHIEDPKTFIAVNKNLTAILALQVQNNFFSYKPVIREVVFYSETSGSGFRLLKEAEGWIDGWGSSIDKVYFGNSGSEEVGKMLVRWGMTPMATVFNFKGEG